MFRVYAVEITVCKLCFWHVSINRQAMWISYQICITLMFSRVALRRPFYLHAGFTFAVEQQAHDTDSVRQKLKSRNEACIVSVAEYCQLLPFSQANSCKLS